MHGRTRNARYRLAADWDAIGEVVAAVPVPVVGNGDLLFPHEIAAARARSGCAAVMSARGVLIKPWLFREASDGYLDLDGEARVAIYRRYVDAGARALGRRRPRAGPACASSCAGTSASGAATPGAAPTARGPTMQHRESAPALRTPLEALLARSDEAGARLRHRLPAGRRADRTGAGAGGRRPSDALEMAVEG